MNEMKVVSCVFEKYFVNLDFTGKAYTRNHNIEDFYRDVKDVQKCKCNSKCDVQHEMLVPLLRPYQRDAVNWMLNKEKPVRNRHTASESCHTSVIDSGFGSC